MTRSVQQPVSRAGDHCLSADNSVVTQPREDTLDRLCCFALATLHFEHPLCPDGRAHRRELLRAVGEDQAHQPELDDVPLAP